MGCRRVLSQGLGQGHCNLIVLCQQNAHGLPRDLRANIDIARYLYVYSYSVSTEAHGVPRDFDVIYVDSCVICVMKQVNSATVPGQDLFKHANVQPDLLQHTKEFTQELIKVGYRCTCAGSRVYERMIHSGGREI